MKKKASFDIQNYLITFLIFIGIAVTFGTVAYSLGQNYQSIGGANISSEYQATYNKLSEIEDRTEDLQEKLEQTDTGTTSADTQFLGSALNSVKLIIPSLAAGVQMVSDMAVTIGAPVIWQQIAITGLIIMILTTIVFMIFKSRGTN